MAEDQQELLLRCFASRRAGAALRGGAQAGTSAVLAERLKGKSQN